MKVLHFLNSLSIGGTEKAARIWTSACIQHGDQVVVISLANGPRKDEFENAGASVRITGKDPARIRETLRELRPDIIHAHAPGYNHIGNVLGEALMGLSSSPPVLQTNVFGRLENPFENSWVKRRLFVSWTSAVQASRRSGRPLNKEFFAFNSVCCNPVEDPVPFLYPTNGSSELKRPKIANEFRARLGIADSDILFGRFSRPDMHKWTQLPIAAFMAAAKINKSIRLLLREPPAEVARELASSPASSHIVILPATSDANELLASQLACDAILHCSMIGESFGYGIAEPMILSIPTIVNSTPWQDQAQLELVRHHESGLHASSTHSIRNAILSLSESAERRRRYGTSARSRILELASVSQSVSRLRCHYEETVAGTRNSFCADDLSKATETAAYLERHQYGHSLEEKWMLRQMEARIELSRLHKRFFAKS